MIDQLEIDDMAAPAVVRAGLRSGLISLPTRGAPDQPTPKRGPGRPRTSGSRRLTEAERKVMVARRAAEDAGEDTSAFPPRKNRRAKRRRVNIRSLDTNGMVATLRAAAAKLEDPDLARELRLMATFFDETRIEIQSSVPQTGDKVR